MGEGQRCVRAWVQLRIIGREGQGEEGRIGMSYVSQGNYLWSQQWRNREEEGRGQ